MVTPEMLLFLAGRVGLERPYICTEAGIEGKVAYGIGGYCIFNPATDDAQFGRLVVWVTMQGRGVTMTNESCCCYLTDDWTTEQWADHDNTPDSIRAAAVVAICKSLGYGEKE